MESAIKCVNTPSFEGERIVAFEVTTGAALAWWVLGWGTPSRNYS